MRMKQKTSAIAGFILLTAAVPNGRRAFAAAPSLGLTPGEYVLTITYEVQEQRQNQSRTATRCVRPKDLANPEEIFNDRTDAQEEKEESCAVKNLKSGNGRISYDADCANRSVHVQGNLSDTGFSVVRTVKAKASQGVSMKFTVRGTRTGACLAKENQ